MPRKTEKSTALRPVSCLLLKQWRSNIFSETEKQPIKVKQNGHFATVVHTLVLTESVIFKIVSLINSSQHLLKEYLLNEKNVENQSLS